MSSTTTHAARDMAPWLAQMAAEWDTQRNDPEAQAQADRRYREALERDAAKARQAREDYLLRQLPARRLYDEPISREKLPQTSLPAVRQAFKWQGTFPGPLLIGPSGTGKTRTAIALLRKLCVEGNLRPKVYRLIDLLADLDEYTKHGRSRGYDGPNPYRTNAQILFIDDLDKFNRQFHSNATHLWAFYDWIQADGRAAITTTQAPIEEWENLISPSFARRLKEAHTVINF